MRKRLIGLFVLSLVPTVFSALAFVNNVVAIARWWHIFRETGGDANGMASHVAGCISWLDWSVVDYSAISTFIPMLGFVSITCSLARLMRGHRLAVDHFPFFAGSDQLNIALGLLGTLWGIIVIGYFRLEAVSMAALMQCLHTALFSTLVAVVWVFMLDRPLLRPFFVRLLERTGQAETGESDLAAAVDNLIVRLGAASDAFDRRQRAYEEAFEKRAREYNEFFRRRIDELERRAEQSEARLKAVAEALHGEAR